MSLHFHSSQFNHAYQPRKLRNWEIPNHFQKRPRTHTGFTQIIANDRGHLLPGIPRPQNIGTGPWGHFLPTWYMPKRITREIAEELRNPKPKKKPEVVKAEEVKKDKEKQKTVTPVDETQFETDPCEDIPDKTQKNMPQEEDLSYVPGDLTEPKHRPPSYQLLRPRVHHSLDDIRSSDMSEKHHCQQTTESPKINPFACVYRNFEMAKKCAKENLEHHPLPDTVTDAMYRKLQMERVRNPGLALKEEFTATGIGWKGYGASGPTQCTKLRVYRPKTCAHKKLNIDDNLRPVTCGSFDKKWRFIKQKNVTPIELAICWDMTPENPKDEPKRTTHIDGSNGSAAPAVFAMVQSPKQPDVLLSNRKSSKESCDGIHGCGTVKSNSASQIRKKISENIDKNNNLDRSSSSSNSLYVNVRRKMSNPTLEPFEKQKLVRREFCKSSPNLSSTNCSECSQCSRNLNQTKKYCRNCEACNKKNTLNSLPLPLHQSHQSDYKMAFKAGKYQENKSVESSNSSGSFSKNSVKVPKQKEPYVKRNYNIDSLHPPFSTWKGTSCQSYPEHWRLASVYQHSYKPVECRKRPLLANVFK